MHTKHRTSLNIVKLYGRDVEIHLWECMLASMYMCMFRTLCISQFQLRPSPPPRATAGHLRALPVPGVGHLQIWHGPGVGHLPAPGLLTHMWFPTRNPNMEDFIAKDSSSSQIGSSVKDWTSLWRFFRFYVFLHCLPRHNYHFLV